MKQKFYRTQPFFSFIIFLMMNLIGFTSKATFYPFSAVYSGANEVPANGSPATGTIVGVYNDVTNTIFYSITFSGLTANTTAAHFHAPALPGVNAGVTLAHVGFPAGVTSGTYSKMDVFTDAQEANLFAGRMYSNIHTTVLPGGEIRAQIILGAASSLICSFNRTYSGANEVPPNTSPATGTIRGVYNSVTNTIFYIINFSGLTANTTAAHFHAPATPLVNAPVTLGHAGFPAGVTSGTYTKSDVFTNAQEANLFAGLMYSNIHTTLLPGGELRTQIIFDAPVVSNMSASPNELWPPTHKMKDVIVNYTNSTNCGVSCQLSVTSNEPVNGLGDGNQSPDWVVVDNHHVKLRAERSGKGDGRVYTITVTCTDLQGNTASTSTAVAVPHNMSSSVNANSIVLSESEQEGRLQVRLLSNPSRNDFTLFVQSVNNSETITVKLFDILGRLAESTSNPSGTQSFRIGKNLNVGIYIAEIRQGAESKRIKLVKQ